MITLKVVPASEVARSQGKRFGKMVIRQEKEGFTLIASDEVRVTDFSEVHTFPVSNCFKGEEVLKAKGLPLGWYAGGKVYILTSTSILIYKAGEE